MHFGPLHERVLAQPCADDDTFLSYPACEARIADLLLSIGMDLFSSYPRYSSYFIWKVRQVSPESRGLEKFRPGMLNYILDTILVLSTKVQVLGFMDI
jgi:hypothetical protein